MASNDEVAVHSPPSYQTSPPHRPRGILKNSSSFIRPTTQKSPEPAVEPAPITERPDLERTLTDKELTLQNTLTNAGQHRRSSSNPRGAPSRRQSGAVDLDDSGNERVTWNEVNLFHNEQQRDSTMKITEPKTPWARNYDPMEDEDEDVQGMSTLDANQIVVDELEQVRPPQRKRTEEIPGLDLGEAEMDVPMDVPMERSDSKQRVAVDPGAIHTDPVESEEHKAFEQSRKKHYRMENVKDILAHPESSIDDEDDDTEEVPPVPTRTN